MTVPSRRVVVRQPFSVVSLPAVARLHRFVAGARRRGLRRVVIDPARKLLRLMRGPLKMGGIGVARLETGAGAKTLRFDISNHQFTALYLPKFADGYEPETAALLDLLVGDGDVFYDVGANFGYFALYIASRPGFSGRVLAFEPFPPTFSDLSSMVDQAGLGGVVEAHPMALSDATGTASIGLPDGQHSGLARLGEDGGVEIDTIRLDDLDGPAPDVMKVDAEDMEAAVLRGGAKTLDAARPAIVFENWLNPGDPSVTMDPIAVLADHGYRLFAVGWKTGGAGLDAVTYAMPTPDADGARPLAVVEIVPEHRFLLPDQLNLLAVHEQRLDWLRGKFED